MNIGCALRRSLTTVSPTVLSSLLMPIQRALSEAKRVRREASRPHSRPSAMREEVPTDRTLAASGRLEAEQSTIQWFHSLGVCDTVGRHGYRSSKMNWYRIYYAFSMASLYATLMPSLTDPSLLINWPNRRCNACLNHKLFLPAPN